MKQKHQRSPRRSRRGDPF